MFEMSIWVSFIKYIGSIWRSITIFSRGEGAALIGFYMFEGQILEEMGIGSYKDFFLFSMDISVEMEREGSS